MRRTLNILIQNRPDADSHPGGDTIQMRRTAQFLREQGHRVDISFELAPNLREYDMVHLFNLTRAAETAAQAAHARRHGKPYLLSSVYWNLETAVPGSAYEFPRNWWRAIMPSRARRAIRRLRTRGPDSDDRVRQAEILAGARLVLPNSEAEMRHLIEQFPAMEPARIRVVLNGIDPIGEDRPHNPSPFPDAPGAFICAGAIGPRKNQLNLVRAFRNLPNERLLIIGAVSPGSSAYLRAVQRHAAGNVTFRQPIEHAQMASVIREAKALVQPSYIETPGLAAMEAAALGVPIVVADVPPVREYFGDLAHYCDPDDRESITSACRAAASAPRADGRAFAERFAWNRVLTPLATAYLQLSEQLA